MNKEHKDKMKSTLFFRKFSINPGKCFDTHVTNQISHRAHREYRGNILTLFILS